MLLTYEDTCGAKKKKKKKKRNGCGRYKVDRLKKGKEMVIVISVSECMPLHTSQRSRLSVGIVVCVYVCGSWGRTQHFIHARQVDKCSTTELYILSSFSFLFQDKVTLSFPS